MPTLHLSCAAALHYETIASGHAQAAQRPVLVFLHEGLGCCAMWKGFPRRLCQATGCDGLMYDRQGYGQSAALSAPRSIHYLHHYALGELPQVLAHCLPQRPYILIGHSDGGSIALLHAAEAPKRLRGAVTLAAHVAVEDVALQGIAAAQRAWDAGELRALHKYHGAKTAAIFHAWSHTWRQPFFARWDIRYALPAITCPVLALQGQHDQFATQQHLQALCEPIAHATAQCIDACAHSPHHEAPETTLALIAQHVALWAAQ